MWRALQLAKYCIENNVTMRKERNDWMSVNVLGTEITNIYENEGRRSIKRS